MAPTTVEQLQISLNLYCPRVRSSPESDFPGLTETVHQHDREFFGKFLIQWIGEEGIRPELIDMLMDFLGAIGSCMQLSEILLQLPFRGDIMTRSAKALASATKLKIVKFETVGVTTRNQDENGRDLCSALTKVGSWLRSPSRETLVVAQVDLKLDSKLLVKVASILPKLNFRQLQLQLKDPESYDEKDLVEAFNELRHGLERNFTLHSLRIEAQSKELNALLSKLKSDKLSLLTRLNRRGRMNPAHLPLNRDTWLSIVSNNLDSINCTYYYLRRNAWLFTPEIDVAAELKSAQSQIESLRRELEAKELNHKAEMAAKDMDLTAKDLEIQKLKSQTSGLARSPS